MEILQTTKFVVQMYVYEQIRENAVLYKCVYLCVRVCEKVSTFWLELKLVNRKFA